MTPANRDRRLQAPAFNQLVGRDLWIVNKPPERHVRSPVALRHLVQTDAARAKHSPEKRRPLLSRRTSPNLPRDKSGSCCISGAPSNQSARERIIQNAQARAHHATPSQSVAPPRRVDALVRKQGPIRRGACVERRWWTTFVQQPKPVVMGPCFRRDDKVSRATSF